jgi:ribosomal protein S18 acetylase RimI-like enzyme
MIEYTDSVEGITEDQLRGFFVGWPNPPNPEVHLQMLQRSDKVVLSVDTTSGMVVGFITAITDGVLAAYIPFLEVLPAYQHQKIGKTLVEKILEQLSNFYMIDLLFVTDLQPFYEQLGMWRATGMFFRNHDQQSGHLA